MAVLSAAIVAAPPASAQVPGTNGWLHIETSNHVGGGDQRLELVAPVTGEDAAPAIPYSTQRQTTRPIYAADGTVGTNAGAGTRMTTGNVTWYGGILATTSTLAGLYSNEQIFPGELLVAPRLCNASARVVAALPDGNLLWQRYFSGFHHAIADGDARPCNTPASNPDQRLDYVVTTPTGVFVRLSGRVVVQKGYNTESTDSLFPSADANVVYDGAYGYDSALGKSVGAVYRIDLTSGERTLVRGGLTFQVFDVSADGRIAIGISNDQKSLVSAELASGVETVLVTAAAAAAVPPATSTATVFEEAVLSPDGTQVALKRDDSNENGGFDTVMVVDVGGGTPRVVRALAAGRVLRNLAWSVSPGVPVRGTVEKRLCGATSCKLKGLAGVTITATRTGASPVVGTTADDGTYTIGLPKGAWTVTPSLRDADFDPAKRSVTVDGPVDDVDFLTCGPSSEPATTGERATNAAEPDCGADFMVDAIDVLQRVQSEDWFTPTRVAIPRVGTVPGGLYALYASDPFNRAVTLVKGVSTIVKVYTRMSSGYADVKPPTVVVKAYHNGKVVATLPLLAKPSKMTDSPSLFGTRIADEDGVYRFSLPAEAMEAGNLTFLAEIQPPKKAECVTLGDVKCILNNRWALRGVPFVTTRPLESRVFRTVYTVAGKPGTFVRQVPGFVSDAGLNKYLPLKPGDLRFHVDGALVDGIGTVAYAQARENDERRVNGLAPLPVTGVMGDCSPRDACNEPLAAAMHVAIKRAMAGRQVPHPLALYPDPVPVGTVGNTIKKPPYSSVAQPNAKTITHELLHQVPLGHASDCDGADISAYVPWPDHRGYINSYGVKPGGRWKLFTDVNAYDVMSYCGRDEEAWISSFHWNRFVNLTRVGGPRGTSALQARALLAVRPGLRVIAALSSDGSRPYLAALPVTAAPSASDPAGTITVTAYDAGGGALASIRTASQADGAVVDVVLPVADPARLELTPDGATATTVLRSANAPTVTLSRPRTARVGRTTTLPVTWTMADADGDALDATVEFSTDGGRRWQTVAGAGPATSIVLPAGSLRGTDNGRLRVTVSDGLRRTSATSGRIRVAGRPPKVTVLTKGTLRAARKATVRLSGYAVDEGGDSLAKAQLRWLLGTRLLGRGENVRVSFATKGARTIRLVATDRAGRATTKTVRVVVR